MQSSRILFPLVLACLGVGCVLQTSDGEPSPAHGGADTLDAPRPDAPGGPHRERAVAEGAPGRTAGTDEVPPGAPADWPASPGAPGEAEHPEQPAPSEPKAPDPGPPPASTCVVDKNADGFFWRTSAKSAYVAYVPASYSAAKPMRAVVGLHGCRDDAMNFATWGVNPWATRAKQDHIGISVSGETGNNKCWSMGADDDKVLAAVDDLAACFWIDRTRVVIAGYSSGGQLAYRVGLMHASSFAGILIENSALYAAGAPADELFAGAAWRLNIAHRAHTGDSVFPIAKVKSDWAATKAAGFPIVTSEVAGAHDGQGADWAEWLLPQSASWVRP